MSDTSIDKFVSQCTGKHELDDIEIDTYIIPEKLENYNVSGFTSWVFHKELIGEEEKPEETKIVFEKGRDAEQEFFNLFNSNHSNPDLQKSNWKFYFEDISGKHNEAKEISKLTVNGKPLWGKPDLVFKRDLGNGRFDIFIVEIKTTFVPNDYYLPPGRGWPNMRAQLWCYAWIDEWKDAQNIYLMGNMFKNKSLTNNHVKIDYKTPYFTCWHYKKDGEICLFETTKEFHNQCLELFKRYGGEFNGPGLFDITENKKKKEKKHYGYCIRTGESIDFNPARPFSVKAYKSWVQFGNKKYKENYCHYSGEKSYGETSFAKPILRKNWDKAKRMFNFGQQRNFWR